MGSRYARPTKGPVRRGKIRNVLSGVAKAESSSGGSSVDTGITELTGDVAAGPGSGSQAATIQPLAVTTGKLAANAVTTAKITDANVTLAKLVDLAALSVLGRASNTSGVMAAITAATDKQVLRRNGTAIGFGAIDLSSSDAVSQLLPFANLADLAALSVLGRASNTGGVGASITAGSDGDVLRRAGTALAFGQIATAGITDAAVTLAKMANLAEARVIGRASGAGTGVPTALTGADLLTIIGSLSGASGAIYLNAGNPQGSLAAPLYSVCINTTTGNWFRKLGGASTAYGWYHWQGIHADGFGPDMMGWRFNESAVLSTAQSAIGMQAWAATTAVNPTPLLIGGQGYPGLQTSAVSGNIAHVRSANAARDLLLLSTDFDYVARIAIPTTITTCRFNTGLFTSTIDDNPNGSTDAAGTSYIQARYDAALDTTWVGVCKAGANNVTTSAAISPTLNAGAPTATVVRIRKVSGTVFFSVDDGTEVSVATNVPSAVAVNFSTSVTTKTTAARQLWVRSLMLTLGVL